MRHGARLKAVALLLTLGACDDSQNAAAGDAMSGEVAASGDVAPSDDLTTPDDAPAPDDTSPPADSATADTADDAAGPLDADDILDGALPCGPDAPGTALDGECPDGRVCRFGGACVIPPPNGAAAPATPTDLATRAADALTAGYGAFSSKGALDWPAIVDAAVAEYAALTDPWDRAWAVVRLGAALGDGHTAVYNEAVCAAFRGYGSGYSNIGACALDIDGELVVSRVTAAAPDGLAVGDTILAFDGRDAARALADLEAQPQCAPSASTPAMGAQRVVDSILYRALTDRTLTVRHADGTKETLDIAPSNAGVVACDGRVGPGGTQSLGAGVATRVLDGDVLYIRLDMFGTYTADGELVDEPVIAALRLAFEEAVTHDGAILDLRANPGGYPSIYTALAGWLSETPIRLYSCRNKAGPGANDFTESYQGFSTPDSTLQFTGKLAILASARSFSAADFTTQWAGSTGSGRARVFGAPTGGGFGSGPASDLGDGWSAAINNLECVDADGNPLEGNPPPVDEPVTQTLEDLLAGRDSVVEAARAWAATP